MWTNSPSASSATVSTASFAPASGEVELNGALIKTVSGPTLNNLNITAGTKQLTSAMTLNGDLNVGPGATFDANAPLDVNGGVALADVTASWDIGFNTHTVAGFFISLGANATGTGTIEFDGTGTTSTGSATIPNVKITAGVRTFDNSIVTGLLEMTSGELKIGNVQTLTVQGDCNLSGGTLSMPHPLFATNEVLDVAGSCSIAAVAGVMSPFALIKCGGNWTSTGLFVPGEGTVEMTGAIAKDITAPSLHGLRIAAGNKRVTTALSLGGDLTVNNGATFDADAAVVVSGDATLGNATASWDLGAHTHSVSGAYTSAGANAIGAGTVNFDGTGTTSTGAATIANARITAGLRHFDTSTVAGLLELLGGELRIGNVQTLTVNGTANLTGGILSMPHQLFSTNEVLDVHGDCNVAATAGIMTPFSLIRCQGNWASTAGFAPAAGTLEMYGNSLQDVLGLTLFNLTISQGTKRLAAPMALGGDLTIEDGATWDCDAPISVGGSAVLGNATASWDVGIDTHQVALHIDTQRRLRRGQVIDRADPAIVMHHDVVEMDQLMHPAKAAFVFRPHAFVMVRGVGQHAGLSALGLRYMGQSQ